MPSPYLQLCLQLGLSGSEVTALVVGELLQRLHHILTLVQVGCQHRIVLPQPSHLILQGALHLWITAT